MISVHISRSGITDPNVIPGFQLNVTATLSFNPDWSHVKMLKSNDAMEWMGYGQKELLGILAATFKGLAEGNTVVQLNEHLLASLVNNGIVGIQVIDKVREVTVEDMTERNKLWPVGKTDDENDEEDEHNQIKRGGYPD